MLQQVMVFCESIMEAMVNGPGLFLFSCCIGGIMGYMAARLTD